MFRQIAIIEKSQIIKGGLSSILKNHEICHQIATFSNFNEYETSSLRINTDIIITSPENLRDIESKIKPKTNTKGKALLIGLVYQYYNTKELSENFDEIIYITDSEDTISNKLKNLYRHKECATEIDEKLTEREIEVLKLLLKGHSNKEAAQELNISPHTVITHRKNIIEKTGIKSLSGLAVYAILNNIADLEDLKQ